MCLLKKIIFKLKQVSKAWYIKIYSFLIDFDMIMSKIKHNLYFHIEEDSILIVLIYVDDLLIIRNHPFKIQLLEQKLDFFLKF